jgi:DNA-directed RNA polymerase subunit RPC12/RpoP
MEFAMHLNYLGRWYNDALMSIELNKYDTTGTEIRFRWQYPNVYRWKHPDSLNVLSNKLGWVTNVSSRPRLWQHFKRWLDAHLLYVRSRNMVEEMKNFVKEEFDDARAGGDREEHDDEIIAGMISLYCGHECEYSDALGMIPAPSEITAENAKFGLRCQTCGHQWLANHMPFTFTESVGGQIKSPERCPNCSSMCISVNRNLEMREVQQMDPDQDLLEGVSVVTGGENDYRNY